MIVLNKCKYLIREERKGGGRWKERREREGGRKKKRGREGGGREVRKQVSKRKGVSFAS